MALTLDKVIAATLELESIPVFCAYILMVVLSRFWKKICPPLNLRPLMIVYNFTSSIVNAYTAYGCLVVLMQGDSFFTPKQSEPLRFYLRIYWLNKIFELLDTVFMILRHKQRQISFLHIYHHASMVLLTDLGQRFFPYIPFGVYIFLNSVVHVFMYSYYGLAALYPENPPQWKKLLTQMQILQFFIDIVHAIIGYLFHGYCIYSVFYGVVMLSLFSNFYYAAYIKKRSERSERNGTKVTNGHIPDKEKLS